MSERFTKQEMIDFAKICLYKSRQVELFSIHTIDDIANVCLTDTLNCAKVIEEFDRIRHQKETT